MPQAIVLSAMKSASRPEVSRESHESDATSNVATWGHPMRMNGSPKDAQQEWTKYYRYSELDDLEVLHARFRQHRFPRHSHEYFVIGYIEEGVQAYTYRGARHVTPAGQVFLVHPDEMHTGEAALPDGYIYRTVYPRICTMERIAAELNAGSQVPFFSSFVLKDDHLSYLLRRFHSAVADHGSRMEVESLLLSALHWLLSRHSDRRALPKRPGRERVIVKQAREYLEANLSSNVSLSELSDLVGVTPFYFARVFENDIGLPPHAFLETLRIRRAKELLQSGLPIVEVALDVGYVDQSHLTHRFKKFLGITPGEYVGRRLQVRNVPKLPLPTP